MKVSHMFSVMCRDNSPKLNPATIAVKAIVLHREPVPNVLFKSIIQFVPHINEHVIEDK